MFDITKIEIENFKSFAQKHTFKFPNNPGIYFLTGENLAQPRLGPNGAGKTSFLDAISWALYGHTTRGLKAADIRHVAQPLERRPQQRRTADDVIEEAQRLIELQAVRGHSLAQCRDLAGDRLLLSLLVGGNPRVDRRTNRCRGRCCHAARLPAACRWIACRRSPTR